MCLKHYIALLLYYGEKGKASFIKHCDLQKWRLCKFICGVAKYRSHKYCCLLLKLVNLMIPRMFSQSRVIFE